ncbi:MAG: helix-turn-helix domain-containing protein [Gemmatimonadaceae bacterium]|nr:helix-turn-helix domain-containing protein [Gemmatimonadaceae bacterium]
MPQLLTEGQVAAMTGLAIKTLQNWRSKRTGPAFVKLGAAVRYRADEITRWIDNLPSTGAAA